MLFAMQKDGFTYVELGYQISCFRVNGAAPVPCPGNGDWAMVEGEIRSLERVIPGGRELQGYWLKPEVVSVVADRLPHKKPADAFEFCDGELIGEHAEFYEPIYCDLPNGLQPVEFEIIDCDCEPVDMPDYVQVEFPNNLKHRRQVQHKYPCRVPMTSVFGLVADAVVAETAKYKELYRLHDCRTIGVLGVEVVLDCQPYEDKVDVSAIMAKRPKWKTVTRSTVTKRILSIVGDYRDKAGAIQITEVRGRDYAELKERLAAYIKGFVDMIDPRRFCVCEKCGGSGVSLKE